MATEARGPDDGGEPFVNPANVHFFRPNDGIYVSEGPEQRTICVSPYLPPAMARSSGEWHVEQFELHKELYRGKTSLLYMATDKVSGVQVALKLYRKRKLSVLNRYQVEREVRLHINLHHENIIHLFAAFEDEKHVYMVQEFAVCGDLFEDLKKGGGQVKEKHAVRDIIVPFLSALAYLHNQGIIHRDIKPENILLGANKVVKVADFGLSININHERPVTRAGTLDYMAPEVLVCPDKRRPEENKDKVLLGYTAQVDSWAVGILAYELLVGYPPFEQESRAATYEHIMYKEPKFPSWMTEEARRFIGLALCKNASQRPTVFDLIQHSWVQPYMLRHMQPASFAVPSPGPSRLRNSVTHIGSSTSIDAAPREHAAAATSASAGSTLAAAHPHAHSQPLQHQHHRQHIPTSASGLSTLGAAASGTLSAGSGGRLFVPVPSPAAASAPVLPAAASSPSSSAVSMTQQLSIAAAADGPGIRPVVHAHAHPPAQSHLLHHQSQSMGPHVHRGPHALSSNIVLKASVSMHDKPPPGSQDPITGVGADGGGGRIHESISDPSARVFEVSSPSNPHPPGATSSASLYNGGGAGSGGDSGGGGAGSRGGHGAAAAAAEPVMDRSGGYPSPSPSVGSSVCANGGGMGAAVRPGPTTQLMSSGPFSNNLAGRVAHANPHAHGHGHAGGGGYGSGGGAGGSRIVPPLALDSSDAVSDLLAGGGVVSGSMDYVPMSPSGAVRSANGIMMLTGMGLMGSTPMASRTTTPPGQQQPGPQQQQQPHAPGVAATGGGGMGPIPPRLRMAALVPPVNVGSAAGAALLGSSVRVLGGLPHMSPAPPISPKPPTPDVAPGGAAYHRPASGVLSDDSFLLPARSPSISLGAQMLSPLQAQLLAPRPGSRLNSPSHSRRNSVSQAGQIAATAAGGVGGGGMQQSLVPQLLSGEYGELPAEETGLMRPPNTHRVLMTAPAGGANGSRALSKLWTTRDPANAGGTPQALNGICSVDSPLDSPGAGSGGGGGSLSARSVPGAGPRSMTRVRVMTPDEMITRPLMRESSMSSSFKGSGGGATGGGGASGGGLREELMQQSLTIYHRPGKVPGIGRAALAAREAEVAEAGSLGLSLAHGPAGGLGKTKSLVNRNLNGVQGAEESGGGSGGAAGSAAAAALARMGSDAALARTAAGAAAAAASGHPVATQRSFTSGNSAFARKLANGAIATKVTEYVKGRLPHDEDMTD